MHSTLHLYDFFEFFEEIMRYKMIITVHNTTGNEPRAWNWTSTPNDVAGTPSYNPLAPLSRDRQTAELVVYLIANTLTSEFPPSTGWDHFCIKADFEKSS